MMTEADYYALFEAYSHGELAGSARASLEARLAADPDFALRYADFNELTGTLRAYRQRQQTRAQLRGIHAAMLAAEAPAEAPVAEKTSPLTHSVNPMLRISRTERKLREFWNGHRATVGVAASVAVMAVFATLLGLDIWRSSKVQAPASIQWMRREINNLKQNQRAINRTIRRIDGTAVVPPINNGKFGGTGFALTSEGYLVTSYHVIKEADSLLVEGRDRQRYRAEPVYSDKAHDLAILRITDKRFTGFGRLPYTFKAGQADLGERVFTLGYPREDVVYGEGSLSARSGFEGDTAAYQISIPVNPGNSGGPLLDAQGNLIGVINARQNDLEGTSFATKSSYLVRLVDSLRNTQPATPYRLPKSNQLTGAARPQQLKKLQDYVFVVKVFEN
ncbi:S1 family peptidase [Hymenobacter properus]|uniref:Trypsin-like peptidase domain-containing protein n=1 Tax=Hymenobacter properus TaxID=2791026 RepID=A0A931BFY2_9BACT|nr:serine protease [Hymenobacter properus]MBF9142759.1 trypsin-like peptidase domain-containing protein [Hymenobacter properus]MBR7721567.1 trypsin-like peptidase domain-containing protein [Microvirga sp. SRT04]